MRADNAAERAERRQLDEDPLAMQDVRLDARPLVVGQFRLFHQNGRVDADLADVMEQSSEVDRAGELIRHSHFERGIAREDRDLR